MTPTAPDPLLPPTTSDRFLDVQLRLASGLAVVVTIVWLMSGGGYLWPRWVWIGLAFPLVVQYQLRAACRAPSGRRRRLAMHARFVSVLVPLLVIIWVSAGGGYFWPMWPMLGLAILLSAHAGLTVGPASRQERALSQRVETLTRSRSGAVDTQAAELRRIERDLHDGAQARMVSLGIYLGMAEDLLARDPDGAATLLADARSANLAALDDLRTLVRGIHPPVLADRGLAGAVEALALDLAVPVSVTTDLPGRLPDAVESAVYFAVAECMANVVKHSGAAAASVAIVHAGNVMSIVVIDDGVGGADIDHGSGLAGVARRLAIFDGNMTVDSPVNGPTVVTLEIPCELSSPKTTRS